MDFFIVSRKVLEQFNAFSPIFFFRESFNSSMTEVLIIQKSERINGLYDRDLHHERVKLVMYVLKKQ